MPGNHVAVRVPLAALALAGGLTSGCGEPVETQAAAALRVIASTTGPDPDVDGYAVAVDGSPGRPLAPNASLTLADLEPGEHRVALERNAPNCAVSGDNPRLVTLDAGATISVTFYVACTAVNGVLVVHAATTGDGQDPDGYLVAVDGRGFQRLAVNGSLTLSALAPGDHHIDVSDVITNCSLGGEAARDVRLRGGETTTLALAVVCSGRRLHVTTSTTGRSPDPDGYTVTVDGGPSRTIGVDGALDLDGLFDGPHTVTLGGVFPFCDPGQNPQVAEVAAASAPVSFHITCTGPPTDGRILLNGETGGEVHVFVMAPDGTGVTDLTPLGDGYGGRWSPDGSKIVFETTRHGDSEVFVMNADGSHPVRLAAGHSPAWSPDGTQIALIANAELAVMHADGTGLRRLASAARPESPSWSPDGSLIAYSAVNTARCVLIFFDPVCARDIHVVRADGTGGHPVTQASAALSSSNAPAWSPDGSTIAFWHSTLATTFATTSADLLLIAPDGTGLVQLTSTADITEGFPIWSPDGRALAFGIRPESGTDDYDVAVIARTGGPPTTILSRPGEQLPTSWR